MMDSQAQLDGLTVGIPAARRATETARLVQRWGGSPLVGPTVREVTATNPAGVVEATQLIIDAPLQWSVHLTGVGTKRWFDLADEAALLNPLLDKLREAGVVARGQKTKAALATVDIQPAWVPEGETSQEIVEWLTPKLGLSDTVALQLHGERAPDLSNAIISTGAKLVEVQSYLWDVPENLEPAQQLVREIVDGRVQALLVTSAPQVRFLAEISERLGLRDQLIDALGRRVFLAAVGTVAAAGLTDLGLEADLVAEPPRMGALVRALAESREQILSKAGN
ncbi:MAG: uroporphyrinogen-III synthase [Actinobacteria bacterium]|nr:uroporphyrinogen-III synthase [Actinomycetota bacterium]